MTGRRFDGALTPPNVNCVLDLPEVCANAGMAPHYGLSNLLGGSWPFRALAQDRVTTAAQRVALYQDADPANDPRIVGTGTEACAYCHRKQ